MKTLADGALDPIKNAVKRLNSLYAPKVSVRELSAFTRQLATMSGAGVPLYQAMNTLWESMEESRLKGIIGKIKDKIKGGTPFSECLSEYPETFPPLMVGLIKVGEVTGMFEKGQPEGAVGAAAEDVEALALGLAVGEERGGEVEFHRRAVVVDTGEALLEVGADLVGGYRGTLVEGGGGHG